MVFIDRNLYLLIKKRIYDACALPVLLYGAECWTPLMQHSRKLNSFHHRCIRMTLGISNRQQWSERITMTDGKRSMETDVDKIRLKRLEWLGHLARMTDNRMPNSVF